VYDSDLCHQCFHNDYANRPCRAIRREVLVLGALLDGLGPLFEQTRVGHDFNVSSCKLFRRPDELFNTRAFAVLVEIDEHNHQGRTELSEIEHVEVIHRWCAERLGQRLLYVLRVNPDGRQPCFRKRRVSNGEAVWEPTEHWPAKLPAVAERLRAWLEVGQAGEVPPELRAAPQGVLVHRLFG